MIIFTIIGAIIGAGFISGQELFVFFFKYGVNGIWGLVICNVLMGYSIYKVLKIVKENQIKNYEDFINVITNYRFTRISKYIEKIINVFLLFSFFIMIAGFGSFFEQEFRINRIFGSSILAITAFILFIGNVKKIVKINDKIVPILIGVIVLVGLYNFSKINIKDISNIEYNNSFYWIIDSIVYASYNILLIIPCLINLKEYIKGKNYKYISIIITVILLIISILAYFLLLKKYNFNKIDMPIVYVIKNDYTNFSILYGVILLIAIFTTAISIGMGLIKNISSDKNNLVQISFIICFFSVIVSNFGFSTLVKIIYPVMGYVGLVEMYYLIK